MLKHKPQASITGKKNIHMNALYRGDDKSLDWPTSQSILFDGENISFDASLPLYI